MNHATNINDTARITARQQNIYSFSKAEMDCTVYLLYKIFIGLALEIK